MKEMDLNIKQKFETYPAHIFVVLNHLRHLIFDVAQQDGIKNITKTLKWGEPSYITPKGSTIRLNWKAKSP